MSEEKTDTPPSTRQSHNTFELILKIVQTLVLIGLLVALAFLTYQLQGFSAVIADITNRGSFLVTVNGVVSIGTTAEDAIAITNLDRTALSIKSSTV